MKKTDVFSDALNSVLLCTNTERAEMASTADADTESTRSAPEELRSDAGDISQASTSTSISISMSNSNTSELAATSKPQKKKRKRSKRRRHSAANSNSNSHSNGSNSLQALKETEESEKLHDAASCSSAESHDNVHDHDHQEQHSKPADNDMFHLFFTDFYFTNQVGGDADNKQQCASLLRTKTELLVSGYLKQYRTHFPLNAIDDRIEHIVRMFCSDDDEQELKGSQATKPAAHHQPTHAKQTRVLSEQSKSRSEIGHKDKQITTSRSETENKSMSPSSNSSRSNGKRAEMRIDGLDQDIEAILNNMQCFDRELEMEFAAQPQGPPSELNNPIDLNSMNVPMAMDMAMSGHPNLRNLKPAALINAQPRSEERADVLNYSYSPTASHSRYPDEQYAYSYSPASLAGGMGADVNDAQSKRSPTPNYSFSPTCHYQEVDPPAVPQETYPIDNGALFAVFNAYQNQSLQLSPGQLFPTLQETGPMKAEFPEFQDVYPMSNAVSTSPVAAVYASPQSHPDTDPGMLLPSTYPYSPSSCKCSVSHSPAPSAFLYPSPTPVCHTPCSPVGGYAHSHSHQSLHQFPLIPPHHIGNNSNNSTNTAYVNNSSNYGVPPGNMHPSFPPPFNNGNGGGGNNANVNGNLNANNSNNQHHQSNNSLHNNMNVNMMDAPNVLSPTAVRQGFSGIATSVRELSPQAVHTNNHGNVNVGNAGNVNNNSNNQQQQPAPAPMSNTTPRSTTRNFNEMSVQSILTEKFSIKQLVEYDLVSRLMKDKNGSRHLQEKIKSGDKKEREMTVGMLIAYLVSKRDLNLTLMAEDVYGNYLIQLLFSRGNDHHHRILLDNFVLRSILRLSKSKYGCRVVQQILNAVKNNEYLIKLVQHFEAQCRAEDNQKHNSVLQQQQQQSNKHNQTNSNTANTVLSRYLQCCNVNRVLQVMVELNLPYTVVKFIGDELERNLLHYSEETNACRVVQSFVKTYGEKLNVCKLLINKSHLYLSEKVHGNYVIQCIIKKGEWYSELPAMKEFRNKLIYDIFEEKNLEHFSRNKHGSNVIEECIRVSSRKQVGYLVNVLCRKQGYLLNLLMKDKFGNYIPKTLLEHCSKRQQCTMVNTIHQYITNLYHFHYSSFRHCSELIFKCQQIKQQIDKNGGAFAQQ